MAADQRAVLDLDVVARAAALEQQMMIARSDQGAPAQHGVVGLRLFDSDAAQPVEPVGEGAGKQLRHVLYDHDARRVGGKRLEQCLQRLGAASGGADDDHFFRGLGHGMRGGGENGVGGELGLHGMTGAENTHLRCEQYVLLNQ